MLSSLSTSLVFGGWLVGAIIGGVLSDIIGRKPVLLVFSFTCSLFGLLASFPHHFWLFILFRLLTGLCIGELHIWLGVRALGVLPLMGFLVIYGRKGVVFQQFWSEKRCRCWPFSLKWGLAMGFCLQDVISFFVRINFGEIYPSQCLQDVISFFVRINFGKIYPSQCEWKPKVSCGHILYPCTNFRGVKRRIDFFVQVWEFTDFSLK